MKSHNIIEISILFGCLASTCSFAAESTFKSPDNAFEFKVPDSLIRCIEEHNTYWLPTDSCMTQESVCNDNAIVCLAYPHAEYGGYNFLAAAFSASILKDANTKGKCLAITRLGPRKTDTINGIAFQTSKSVEGWAGGSIEEYTYWSFHRNQCYELSIRIAYSQFSNYESGSIKRLTAKDRQTMFGRLKRMIQTFKFL